jgi:hypothetical protein
VGRYNKIIPTCGGSFALTKVGKRWAEICVETDFEEILILPGAF